MCSGKEVVGAATIPPVGAKVRALSVINERRTASDHCPALLQVADHSPQNRSVCSKAAYASGSSGAGKWEGTCVSVKGTSSPAPTTNSPEVLKSFPERSTGAFKKSDCGPATALRVSSLIRLI